MNNVMWKRSADERRGFIGGSDARIILGSDEAALLRLWREKRGEIEPEDLSGNLLVQLGVATEELDLTDRAAAAAWQTTGNPSRLKP